MAIGFFKLEARTIIPGDWGDYGYILEHGMTAHSPRLNGKLALERTGPYISPITFPGIGSVLLTDEARKHLEGSGLGGFSFLPVEKKLIVELHWEQWDLTAVEPPEYPDSGEPEDYILERPHSAAAYDLGDLWELLVPVNVEILRLSPIVASYKEFKIDLRTWDGSDLLRSKDFGGILFSERARQCFSELWGRYLEFLPFPAD
jgi:hypothetical protein